MSVDYYNFETSEEMEAHQLAEAEQDAIESAERGEQDTDFDDEGDLCLYAEEEAPPLQSLPIFVQLSLGMSAVIYGEGEAAAQATRVYADG